VAEGKSANISSHSSSAPINHQPYSSLVEFRQLEAFVEVATQLHFGRAAEKLGIAQPTLSELVRRLEREIGTPLLARTTRRVALTRAGKELLERAQSIIDSASEATLAVRRVANDEAGTVRLGVIPAAAAVLAPHVAEALHRHAPDITLDMRRMWPPDLLRAVTDGTVDVAINCGSVVDPPGVVGEVFCGEGVVVALRNSHPLAAGDGVLWADLADETFGIPSATLFPDWSAAQQRVLDQAGICPPIVELDATDLAAADWPRQSQVDWVMSSVGLIGKHEGVKVLPVSPMGLLSYKLQWNPSRAHTSAAARFVQLVLTVAVPPKWVTQPGHLRFDAADSAAHQEDSCPVPQI
jgi:DNA-binding transcriptional LysR family regulator